MTTLKNQSLRLNRSINRTIRSIKRTISPEHIVIILAVFSLLSLIFLMWIESFWAVLPIIGMALIILIITNNERQ